MLSRSHYTYPIHGDSKRYFRDTYLIYFPFLISNLTFETLVGFFALIEYLNIVSSLSLKEDFVSANVLMNLFHVYIRNMIILITTLLSVKKITI